MGISLLIYSRKFPPAGGGVSLAGHELASAFAMRGYEVSVVTTSDPHDQASLFAVYSLATPEHCTTAQGSANERMNMIWGRIRPGVVIINGVWDSPGDEVIQLARIHAIPVIFRSHGVSTAFSLRLRSPPFFGFGQWLRSISSAKARIKSCASFSQIVFLSSREGLFKNFDRRLACKYRLANVSDIPNSFSPIRRTETAFRIKYNISSCFFLCIASFSSLKNQKAVIRAVRQSDISGAAFVFIAPEKNRYASESEALAAKDPRFAFLYGLPREEVLEAHNASDCVFLFSTHEQQPLVLLEAMSCGKPWICTDVGSVGEMRGGIVLGRRRSKDLIQAIKTMQDPETRVRFGREGYEQWVDKFSPESVYARWDKLLEDVAARKPVRGGY